MKLAKGLYDDPWAQVAPAWAAEAAAKARADAAEAAEDAALASGGAAVEQLFSAHPMVRAAAPVSYTHLTLPTIYSV